MNERIEKLAERCGFRSNPDIYDRNQSFDIPKFAELIIEESIKVMMENDYHGEWLGEKLKEHFGVKE